MIEALFSCFKGSSINKAACDLAKEVASEGDALVCGGFSQTPSYLSGSTKEAVQAEFRKQKDVFVENGVDFLLCEVQTNPDFHTVYVWFETAV